MTDTLIVKEDVVEIITVGTQGPPGSTLWGGVTGTLSDQVDLQSALNLKSNATHTHYVAVPASETATGTAGQTSYDANYFYICVATDTWKRLPLVW